MKQRSRRAWAISVLWLMGAGCGGDAPKAAPDPSVCTPAAGALATQLTPRFAPAYYIEQGSLYFDAIDVTAPAESVPTYAKLVARWEWPPWLKLTGYTSAMMAATDMLVKAGAPAAITPRDCRFFPVQPFARCRVAFRYTSMGAGKPCQIYEEFTFNDQGEMTFIEAWSDLPQLLPTADPADPWAEGRGVHRLATKIPGLGTPTGRIELDGACMKQAAARDPEVADFVARANDFWPAWADENTRAGSDYFTRGCGW